MDIVELKSQLKDNPEDIVKILEFYSYEKIKVSSKEIRCARDEVSNASSIRVKLNDSLTANDFGKNIDGDLFSIIMHHKNLSFIETLNDIKNVLNISDIAKKHKVLPFNGLFQKVTRLNQGKINIKVYDEDVLLQYPKCWNVMFLKDNIHPKIQLEFGLGYDESTQRITVPWRSTDGKVVGIMGRLNYKVDEDEGYKWFPIIPFGKVGVLYGFSENYQYILKSEDIYIGESEKFVLQLASYGYRNCVSLGGNNVSEYQIKHILTTNPKNIYLCYDEGLAEEVIDRAVESFKPFIKMKEINLFVVKDTHNKYLKLGSKDSPSDLGRKTFENIIENCSVKVGK